MKFFSFLYGVGLGIVLAISPAIAGNRDFTLVNDTRSVIDGVWISTSDDNIWHVTHDFKTLYPGKSAPITFEVNDSKSPCILQLRIHLPDLGASVTWDEGFNFCKLRKVKVWYNYDRKAYRVTYY